MCAFAGILCCKKRLCDVSGTRRGKGFADIVFVPRKFRDVPAIVVELKWDKSSDAAIAQIKKKQYMQSLKDYHGQVILVGINYDNTDSVKDDYKRHSCRIERIKL